MRHLPGREGGHQEGMASTALVDLGDQLLVSRSIEAHASLREKPGAGIGRQRCQRHVADRAHRRGVGGQDRVEPTRVRTGEHPAHPRRGGHQVTQHQRRVGVEQVGIVDDDERRLLETSCRISQQRRLRGGAVGRPSGRRTGEPSVRADAELLTQATAELPGEEVAAPQQDGARVGCELFDHGRALCPFHARRARRQPRCRRPAAWRSGPTSRRGSSRRRRGPSGRGHPRPWGSAVRRRPCLRIRCSRSRNVAVGRSPSSLSRSRRKSERTRRAWAWSPNR